MFANFISGLLRTFNFIPALTNAYFLLTAIYNGYVTFVISILFIGGCTAVIGDIASHLGCFIFLKDGVNAIAFVALGTSVPGIYHVADDLPE